MKKRFRVSGHATVTVTTVVEIDVDDDEELAESDIYDAAWNEFGGIQSYAGNGGIDKIIGVSGWDDTIDADDEVEFDDFWEEEE